MKLSEVKKQVIKQCLPFFKENIREAKLFTPNINGCNNIWDLIYVLECYGWDKQGALSIIFSITIK